MEEINPLEKGAQDINKQFQMGNKHNEKNVHFQ